MEASFRFNHHGYASVTIFRPYVTLFTTGHDTSKINWFIE